MKIEVRRALVVDDDVAVSAALQRLLEQLGFTATIKNLAADAASVVRGNFDVILLDIGLPDLNGHAFMRQLRRNGVTTPVIMITASEDIDDAILALRNEALDLLRKPIDLAALDAALQRVRARGPQSEAAAPPESPTIQRVASTQTATHDSALIGAKPSAPASIPTRPQVQQLRARLERGEITLPVIDPRLASLQRFLSDDDFTMEDVANVVMGDPALTAGVLRLANSAYFSRGEIASVVIACQRLGTSRVVGIALEVAMQNQFQHAAEPFRSVLRELWRNSVVTAHLARELGPLCKIADRDRLHVTGLLHNIGELAAARLYAEAAPDIPLEQLALEIAAIHEELGEAVAKAWSLPAYVIALAGSHHRARRGEPAARRTLRHVILASWTMAIQAGYSYLPNQDAAELPRLLASLGLTTEAIAPIVQSISALQI